MAAWPVRSPWAPYVARPGVVVPGVDDSKKLTPELRQILAVHLKRDALAWAVVSISSDEIDRFDILEATRRAMRAALLALRRTLPIRTILTDAVPLADAAGCVAVVKADSLCYSVASASILAKVERDRAMVELGERYPNYGFAEHKGYGSIEHREALAVYGPCPEHRLTFASVLPRRTGSMVH